ncbi:hypothetical protein SDJN03_25500, partial [Cucurbita argyrosperma subsp. sororia]
MHNCLSGPPNFTTAYRGLQTKPLLQPHPTFIGILGMANPFHEQITLQIRYDRPYRGLQTKPLLQPHPTFIDLAACYCVKLRLLLSSDFSANSRGLIWLISNG